MTGVLKLLETKRLEYLLSAHWKECTIEVSSLSLIYVTLTLLMLPLLDLVVIPLLRHLMCHPSILKCMGIGGMLTLLSAVTMFTLQGVVDRTSTATEEQCIFADSEPSVGDNEHVNIYWMFLPVILHSMAQVLLYVPSKYNKQVLRGTLPFLNTVLSFQLNILFLLKKMLT